MIKVFSRPQLALAILVLTFAGLDRDCLGQSLQDLFANREVVTDDAGQLSGNNALATVEPNEPLHAGKIGGHSLWISWVPAANGIATIDTTDSSFDTLLAVYTLAAGTNNPMLLLQPVVANDDNGTLKTSLVQFGVIAGTRYEIAVDGYHGAVGNVTLNWTLTRSDESPPISVSLPPDHSVLPGDTLVLTPNFADSSPVGLQWFFNGQAIPDATNASLVIPNFQDVNVGRYVLRFTVDADSFLTQPIEVQINTEGVSTALARDKFQDALNSELDGPSGLIRPLITSGAIVRTIRPLFDSVGVVRGYSGTQIFNTLYATSDPSEPQHCGVVGGASYWFGYYPPTNGVAQLNTDGSNFDTVLAVYSFTPPLLSYAGLIPVTCDNNSGSNGLTSRLQFTADPQKNYLIVVDGVNGARGIAYLNYALNTPPATNQILPTITQGPISRSVAAGSAVTFTLLANGTAPVQYCWLKNGAALAMQTNLNLTLTNVQPSDSGGYSVIVANSMGSATSAVASLTVVVPPSISLQPSPLTRWVGANASFAVGAAGTVPLHYLWNKNGVPITNLDSATLTLSNIALSASGNYSAQVFNVGGAVVSIPAALAVVGQPSANLDPVTGAVKIGFPAAGPLSYVVESTASLSPPAWSTVTGALTTNNGVIMLPVDPRTNVLRFFRVRLP